MRCAVATGLGRGVALGCGGLLRRRDERLGLGEGWGEWFTLGEEGFLDLRLGLVATRGGRAMAMLRDVMLPGRGGQLTSVGWRLSALERRGTEMGRDEYGRR